MGRKAIWHATKCLGSRTRQVLAVALLAGAGNAHAQEGPRVGFAWADQPTAARYAPDARYTYNAADGPVEITRSGPGTYTVRFSDLSGSGEAGGNVQVTGYGPGAEWCKVVSWNSVGADFVVHMACFDVAGVLNDARFSVRAIWGASPDLGYAWANHPVALSYAPDTTYASNGAGGGARIARSGIGRYTVRFPGLGRPVAGGTVLVTGYGPHPDWCKAESWSSADRDFVAEVRCFAVSGDPTDARFSIVASWPTGTLPSLAYAWADRADAASYSPSAAYAYNLSGQPIQISRTGVGAYRVQFMGSGGRDAAGGNVHVTAYGPGSEVCKVLSWDSSGDDFVVLVNCYDRSGRAVNAEFVLNVLGRPAESSVAVTQCHLAAPGTRGIPDWRLNLDYVRVVLNREASGDRPYFATLVFRSCYGGPGSSRVDLVEREPHDWVRFDEYRGDVRLLRSDHMILGEALRIPEWMGRFSWEGMQLVPVSRGLPTEPPWLFGAVIFSFDNNNTPPHVIRNILNTVRDNLLEQLQAAVERTAILTWSRAHWNEAAANLADGVGNFGDLFQLSIGSTFNPDKPTGIQLLVWSATTEPLSGLSDPSGTRILSLTGGDRVELVTQFMNPAPQPSLTLRFTGSGAVYDVAARFERFGGDTVAWQRINARAGVVSLAACGNGRVYALHGDGTLVSTVGASASPPWQTHGRLANAERLSCAGTTLFVLGHDRELFTATAPSAEATVDAPYRVGRPYAAALIGAAMSNDLPMPWVLNDDRSLWYNGQGGTDGRWVRVGRPGSAARLAGAPGRIFVLNDDRTLWVSTTGGDGTWRQIDRLHAAVEITATARASNAPATLYALHGDGTLWRGTVTP